jgi:MFS family permease
MIGRWARTTFESLGDPHFRILWFGTSLAFLAFMMQFVLQSIVAFDLTGRNTAVGFVGVGMGVATIAIAPFGGAIADRVSKRKLLLVGQSTIGASFFAVGVLILTGLITIYWLVAATFVMGCVFSFIAPARQAWVGELLPRDLVPNGIALTQVSMTATRIIGPFLAGALIAIPFVGTGGAFLVMGGMFVVVVLTLAKLPPSRPRDPSLPPTSMLADLRGGLRHMQERPRLQLLAYGFILVAITGYSFQVVMPGFLENQLDLPSERLWIILVVSAVTGLAATVGLASIAGSRWAWPAMLIGCAALGVSLIAAAFVPSFTWLLVCMLLTGAGMGGFQMLNNALIMRESEPAYYGRVMSLTMLAWGFHGIAGLPVGMLADALGEREACFVLGTAVVIIAAVSAIIYPTISGRETPVGPEPALEAAAID